MKILLRCSYTQICDLYEHLATPSAPVKGGTRSIATQAQQAGSTPRRLRWSKLGQTDPILRRSRGGASPACGRSIAAQATLSNAVGWLAVGACCDIPNRPIWSLPNSHSPANLVCWSALRREWGSKGKGAKREQSHAQHDPTGYCAHGEHPPFDRARAKRLSTLSGITDCESIRSMVPQYNM